MTDYADFAKELVKRTGCKVIVLGRSMEFSAQAEIVKLRAELEEERAKVEVLAYRVRSLELLTRNLADGIRPGAFGK